MVTMTKKKSIGPSAKVVFFVKPEDLSEDLPPWKIVIRFDDLDDDIIEPALAKMIEQFEMREVTNIGEMLHIFSLMIVMARNGTLKENMEQIIEKSKKYIDYLLEHGTLLPLSAQPQDSSRVYEAHDGYAYWVNEENKSEFNTLINHLIRARKEAMKRMLPSIGIELLDLMESDVERFCKTIKSSEGGIIDVSKDPVLLEINPFRFVEKWLGNAVGSWRLITLALDERFERYSFYESLKYEKTWGLLVRRNLINKAEQVGGYGGMRIQRIVPVAFNRWYEDDHKKE